VPGELIEEGQEQRLAVDPTGATEDSELRRLATAAGVAIYASRKPAADFDYPDVTTGRRISLRMDLSGKIIVLNMWATWCQPCKKEMPSLQVLFHQFQDQGLVVVAINVRESNGAAKSKPLVAAWGLTFPVLEGPFRGPEVASGKVPETILVDKKGRVVGTRIGELDWSTREVRHLVSFLLAEEE
jgi:thiol-disulfide isomerase/thioredoxin